MGQKKIFSRQRSAALRRPSSDASNGYRALRHTQQRARKMANLFGSGWKSRDGRRPPRRPLRTFFAIILRFRADSDSARASMSRAIVRDKKRDRVRDATNRGQPPCDRISITIIASDLLMPRNSAEPDREDWKTQTNKLKHIRQRAQAHRILCRLLDHFKERLSRMAERAAGWIHKPDLSLHVELVHLHRP